MKVWGFRQEDAKWRRRALKLSYTTRGRKKLRKN
jgi:hypothetical protein